MAVGYPVGAVVGGSILKVLHDHDWRAVFYLGGSVTATFIPVLLLVVLLEWIPKIVADMHFQHTCVPRGPVSPLASGVAARRWDR